MTNKDYQKTCYRVTISLGMLEVPHEHVGLPQYQEFVMQFLQSTIIFYYEQ